jgi:hypothetical protein
MLQGYLENVTAAGLVRGWARDVFSPRPLTIEVRWQGGVVARAVADLFRGDLLDAGLGHGHFGFLARLIDGVPPGERSFSLTVAGDGGAEIRPPAVMVVPPRAAGGPLRVERLLVDPPRWSDRAVLAATARLGLDATLRELGTAGFVEAVYAFALSRSPTHQERAEHADALSSGGIDPSGLFGLVMTSEERSERLPPLPSPNESGYPFVFDPAA